MFENLIYVSGRSYKTRAEAAEAHGLTEALVLKRLEAGWDAQTAYTRPHPYGEVRYKGVKYSSLNKLAKAFNQDPPTVRKRLRRGLTMCEALKDREPALKAPLHPKKPRATASAKAVETKAEPKIELETQTFDTRLDLLLGKTSQVSCIVKPMMFQIQTPEGQVLGEVSTVTKTNDQVTARLTVEGQVVTPEILRTLADNLEFYAYC